MNTISRRLWAALVTIVLLTWPPSLQAAPKSCGDRSEIQAYLENLQQRKVGFTVSSTAGRLELWTSQPIETFPGMFIAARWSGISVSKEMCIEVEGTDWIFMTWNLG